MKFLSPLVIICFHLCSTAPIGRTRHSNANDNSSPLPTKKTRLSDPCFFSVLRKSDLETSPRPVKSEVSMTCSGELHNLSKYFNEPLNADTGNTNPVALLLCRGAAQCKLNFTDPETIKNWENVKICDNHADELLLKWEEKPFLSKHIIRSDNNAGKTVNVCSMPAVFCPKHRAKPSTNLRILKVHESQAILERMGFLVHPGIPICETHDELVTALTTPGGPPAKKTRYSKSSYAGLDTETCAHSDPDIVYDEKKSTSRNPAAEALAPFAKYVKVTRVCFPQKPFTNLEEESKQKKVCAVKQMIDVIANIVAPGSENDLKNKVFSKYEDREEWTSGSSKQLDSVLKQVAAQYFAAEDRRTRLIVLGLVSNSVTLSKVREYIPDLSSYLYTEARKFARRSRDVEPPVTPHKERYNSIAVQSFISPTVLIGLPYGVRKVKLSDGTKKTIPDSIRQQSSSEIYTMYEAFLQETNQTDLHIGKSSIFEILNVCAATNRKATSCVDYFVANGLEAFDGLHLIIDGWLEEMLTADDILKYLKNGLLEGLQYLRTDFKIHVKHNSRVADHCSQFGLSDPTNSKMAASCSSGDRKHKHDIRCDRCELLKSTLSEIEKFAHIFLADAEEILTEDGPNALEEDKQRAEKRKEESQRIKRYSSQIFEMKKHILRAAYTSQERQNIINELEDNHALVTLDFAQKFLPTWHREKQADYFAKKGISWHVSHVTAKIAEKYVQHTFVHIYSQDISQDSSVIVQTISHIATELKKVGIKMISFRSDNAGCYHSTATIHSLHWLMENTTMPIDSWSYSEAQNGKGASDRAAAQVKYRAERYVAQGHDITNSEQFFSAMKYHQFLNGFSFYHGTITADEKVNAKWPGIASLNMFKVEKSGIRAWRYGGIGEGVFVHKNTLQPIKGSYNFEEAGFIATGIQIEDERAAIIAGTATKFWYSPECVKQECAVEPDLTTPEIDDSMKNDIEIGNLFSCPEPGCSASFLKSYNLEKHVLRDKHKKSPEKLTQRDFGLKLYVDALEKVETEHTSTFAREAMDQLKETNFQTSLMEGYGLPEKQKRAPFGEKVIKFLTKCFDEGWKKKSKPMDPVVVAKKMETEKNADGSKMFEADEWKTSRQIAGFFSREAEKRRNQARSKRLVDPAVAKTSTGADKEYIPDEEDHDDFEWIRWLKDEAFMPVHDEYFIATVDSPIFNYTNPINNTQI